MHCDSGGAARSASMLMARLHAGHRHKIGMRCSPPRAVPGQPGGKNSDCRKLPAIPATTNNSRIGRIRVPCYFASRVPDSRFPMWRFGSLTDRDAACPAGFAATGSGNAGRSRKRAGGGE
jgi:hypothetical protein